MSSRKRSARSPTDTRRKTLLGSAGHSTGTESRSEVTLVQITTRSVVGSPLATPWENETESDKWAVLGSNQRPSRCKRDALPTELTARAQGM
jgi:hypothetical protein